MPYDFCRILRAEQNPVLFEASPPNPGGFEGRTSSSTSLPGYGSEAQVPLVPCDSGSFYNRGSGTKYSPYHHN